MKIINENLATDMRDGADVLCVHFSSRNKGPGKFHVFPVPDDASHIYLNPADLNWYLDGLPCFGVLEKTIEKLGLMIEESRARKVLFVGSSMGAWGAAYYASKLPATHAMLFGTELTLNCYGGYSLANLLERSKQGEIPTVRPNPACTYTLVTGSHSPSDIACATAFSEPDLSRIWVIQGFGHTVAAELNRHGLLARAIRDCLADRTRTLDALQHDATAEILNVFKGRTYARAVLKDYLSTFTRSNEANAFLEGALHDMGVKKLFADAIFLATEAEKAFTLSAEVQNAMIRIARKAKNVQLARRLINDLKRHPTHALNALWEHALLTERHGTAEESAAAFKQVADLTLQDARYVYSASKSQPQ